MRKRYMILVFLVVLICTGSMVFAGGAAETKTVSERGHVSVTMPDRGTVPPDMGTIEDNHWVEWFRRNAPVDVEFVGIPAANRIEVLNTRFAAGTAPDILYPGGGAAQEWRVNLKHQGLIQPIGDAIERWSVEYKEKLENFPIMRTLGNIDGQLYQIGRINGLSSGYGLIIRSDWLENVGLDVPTTAEELFNVARAFTEQDPNRSGRNDTYGIGMALDTNVIIDTMFQNVMWIEENGRMVKDWDRVIAATEFKKRLYDAGYTDPDFVTDPNHERTLSDFITGRVGIIGRQNIPRSQGYHTFTGLRQNDPDAQILIIPLPRTQFGQFSPSPLGPVVMMGVINARKADLEPVIKFIDFMTDQQNQLILRHGFEGHHHERNPENGCFIYDMDVYQHEVAWNSQIHNLYDRGLEGECFKYKETLDMSDPLAREWAVLHDMAEDAYVNSPRERPWPQLLVQMEPLPPNLALQYTNIIEAYEDVWVRAIVGGRNFSTERALTEARRLWNAGSGPEIEKFYDEWYAENKDTAFTTTDLIDFAVKVNEYNENNWLADPLRYRNELPEGWGTPEWWSPSR